MRLFSKSMSAVRAWLFSAPVGVSVFLGMLSFQAIAGESGDIDTLTAACGAKATAACIDAAKLYQSKGDQPMAMMMQKRACFLKHKSSCTSLAHAAIAAGDVGLAREALEESCRYGSDWGCKELTKIDLAKKKSESDDPKKSSLVWSLACAKGSGSGCRKQGESELRLGQRDAARASFLRACSLGDKASCAQLNKPSDSVPAH